MHKNDPKADIVPLLIASPLNEGHRASLEAFVNGTHRNAAVTMTSQSAQHQAPSYDNKLLRSKTTATHTQKPIHHTHHDARETTPTSLKTAPDHSCVGSRAGVLERASSNQRSMTATADNGTSGGPSRNSSESTCTHGGLSPRRLVSIRFAYSSAKVAFFSRQGYTR